MRARRQHPAPGDLAHLSPLGWERIKGVVVVIVRARRTEGPRTVIGCAAQERKLMLTSLCRKRKVSDISPKRQSFPFAFSNRAASRTASIFSSCSSDKSDKLSICSDTSATR